MTYKSMDSNAANDMAKAREAALSIGRNGQIRVNMVPVGYVFRLGPLRPHPEMKWRAEIGKPENPDTYRVAYGETRGRAVADALEGFRWPE